MKPPQHLIDKMLADGEIGILSSLVVLGAALAVQRGSGAALEGVQTAGGEPIPPGLEARMKEAHAAMVEEFQAVSAEELDHCIALSTAHLRAAGYQWTSGRDN